jgi:hypothetical protein
VRTHRYILIGIAAASLCGPICTPGRAQDVLFGAAPPLGVDPAGAPPANTAPASLTPIGASDAANIDGCQVVARIDHQIVQACEVLWHVNKIIEQNQDKIPPDQVGRLRQELLKKELGGLLDRKLLYGEFVRTVPAENLPHIAERLVEPFEEREVPLLMKQLEVGTPVELERELTRLGSSMSDVRQAFNEKAIAYEWLRTKVKVSEEVSPDEMLGYYQSHLSSYDEPARVRWEELMVRKSRFNSPAEAYAEIANMGNEVWRRAAARPNFHGPAFADVAKAKSHGFKAQEEGGQQPWTTKGALKITAIDEALFVTLQVGQMSPILETEDAFYIVRVLERKEAGRKPFTDVQARIREDLKEERFGQAVEKYLGGLRKDARIWTAFTGDISAEELIARRPEDAARR